MKPAPNKPTGPARPKHSCPACSGHGSGRSRARTPRALAAVAATLALLVAQQGAFADSSAKPPAEAQSQGRAQGWLGLLMGSPQRDSAPRPFGSGRGPAASTASGDQASGAQTVERSGEDMDAREAVPPPGVPIAGVVAGSPAQKAGLRARDLVLAIDGKPVITTAQVIAAVGAAPADSWVTLSIRRKTKELDLRAFLAERPKNAGSMRMIEGWIGVEMIDLPPELREHFGAPKEAGIMISKIDPDGPAYAGGLELGDVVFEIEGEPIRSPRDLQQSIMGGGVGNKVEIRLARSGAEILLETLVEAKPEKSAVAE